MNENINTFNGKKILITGNSGFKGAWLTLYLNKICNSKLYGFSDMFNWKKGIFNAKNITNYVEQYWGNIKDFNKVNCIVNKIEPDIIFHFAAQPIVSEGYKNSKNTYETNINGTLNLFESIKNIKKNVYIIIITSDKVYKNNIRNNVLDETSSLGGICPYSSSKACVEIISETYSYSLQNKFIYTVRAGNVIGGGDWSENRIIPDIFRAYNNNKPLKIRNPNSVRPWSYVLDIIRGYLDAAQNIINTKDKSFKSFNFSSDMKFKSVNDISRKIFSLLTNEIQVIYDPLFIGKEAEVIKLCSMKAKKVLGWQALYDYEPMIKYTTSWYRKVIGGDNPLIVSEELLENYLADYYKCEKNFHLNLEGNLNA